MYIRKTKGPRTNPEMLQSLQLQNRRSITERDKVWPEREEKGKEVGSATEANGKV